MITFQELLILTILSLAIVSFLLSRIRSKSQKMQMDKKVQQKFSVDASEDVIEPLRDFDWTKVDVIPYRPFQNKLHVVMGIQKMAKRDWIRIDKGYAQRMEERKQIMDAHPGETIGSGPEVDAAIEELYEEIMVKFLPRRFPTMFKLRGQTFCNKVTGGRYSVILGKLDHDTMLRNLGENIEEDFYFMCPDGMGEIRLQGWIACFPGGFLTTARKGMTMREIHSPVPGYNERIGKGADRTLSRLEPGRFIQRYNWSLQTDGPDLFRVDGNNFYPDQGQILPDGEDAIDFDTCFLRVEHQTLLMLPLSRAIVFCVRSYLTSLHDIKAEGNGPLLAEAVESMPLKLGNYKKRPFWQTQVCKALR